MTALIRFTRGSEVRLGLVAALFAMLLVPRPAAAAENANDGVDPFYGAFGTEVPIEIPPFHSLEPTVKLSYSSTGRNGFVGVGWALAAGSSIERASPGMGSPRYDGSDIFRLDGQELVGCTMLGGTHCTKIQNYMRIVKNGDNTWDVWRKDGTRAHYTPLFQTSKGTFRWGLSTLVDTHGNTVTFNYWCDPGAECYLSGITYNGTSVTFFRELRPDPFSYATGAGLATVRYRLKSVFVWIPGVSHVRAYALSYVTSSSTGRSLLAGVQQFGRDVSHDGSGGDLAGTALPPMQPDYWEGPSGAGTFTRIPGAMTTYYQWHSMTPLDFNGDGCMDYAINTTTAGAGWFLYRSNCDGTFTRIPGAMTTYYQWHDMTPLDFNGDGCSDYAINTATANAGWYLYRSNCDGTFTRIPGAMTKYYQWHSMTVGDWNGDGKSDYAINTTTPGAGWYLYLSNGDGTFARVAGAMTTYYQWHSMTPLDFNGDGCTDYAINTTTAGAGWYLYRSDCDGTFTRIPGAMTKYYQWHSMTVGDWNGDGRSDYAINTTTPGAGWYLYLSDGDGTFTRVAGAMTTYYQWNGMTPLDFNGDGCTDYAINTTTAGAGWYLYRSDCDGTFTRIPGSMTTYYQWHSMTSGDWDGDGKADYAINTTTAGAGWYLYLSANDVPDLLATLDNGLGGTTTIAYAPSSSWSNTYLPVGMVMQTVSSVTTADGRGHSATTSYQYEGGLWSASERRFLGFRKVTGVIDAAGNYTETYYHQHVGCISKPEVTYYRSATGAIYSYSTYEYQESASAPYTSLLTDRWDYACEGGGTCQRVLTQLGYDVYGNVVEAREYGNYDAAGDERTTVSGFYPNTSAYIVGKKGYENVYEGIGTSGRLMKRELRYFDGQGSYTSPAQVGDMTMRKRWNDQTGGYVTESYGYDGYGNVTLESDGLGYDETTAYDGTYHVYPTQECDALGHCRNRGYDYVLGKVASETDTNGNTATRTYDAMGRPVRLTRPDGSWVERQYVSWGSASAQKVRTRTSDGTGDGLWEDAYFDGMQREYKRVKEGGATRLTEYFEGTTRVWKQSLWYAPGSESARYVVRSYDGSGRVVRVTAPDGSHADTTYAICYNAADSDFAAPRACTTKTDELGHSVREATDGFGQVVNRSEWNGSTEGRTHYSYDVLGREIQVRDALGNVRTESWDSLGNLLSVCDPDLGCWSYGYDAAGRRVSATDAKGQTTTMEYDGLGRRLSETAADGSVVTYSYDESGHGEGIGSQPTSVSWDGGSDSRSYDAAGRVVSQTRCILGQCETVGWSYDAAGRLSSVSYPGEVVSYSYDSAGNLASVPGYASALVHDARGQLTRIDFANGTSQSYSYDANRAWLSSSAVTRSGATLYQASYGYDAAARVTQMSSSTDSRLNLTLGYDALNRLTGVSGGQSESYGYDKLGRITSKSDVGSYSYGAGHDHAATTAGGQSYSYDANGSMTGGAGRTMEWDAKNRLSSVTKAGVTSSFGYDPNGQRTYKVVGNQTTRYFGKLVERSASGQLQTYVYAGAMLLAKKAGSSKLYYHTDHLGSVQLVTDGSGNVVKTRDYAPYGKTLLDSGSADDARGFGGHDYDADTGLVYMNARYYDPVLGRFISADTVIPDPGNPQALDRYAFAYGNPISNADPSGHAPVVVAVVAAASVCATTTSVVIAAVAIAGAVCVTAGYVLKDPTLMTIGGVLLGFATGYVGPLLGGGLAGGLLGAAVAAATSPLSPLDPGLKQAIGWAYAAACFTAAQMKASQTLEDLQAGAQKQAANEGLTVDQVREMGFEDPNRAMMSAHVISKDAVGYTMRDALNAAKVDGNLGLGMVGPGSGTMTTILDNTVGRIPSVQLHGILHDAYGLAYNTWGVGPGYHYSGTIIPGSNPGSALTGQATGVFRNSFLAPVNMSNIDAMSGSLGHQLESLSWDWASI